PSRAMARRRRTSPGSRSRPRGKPIAPGVAPSSRPPEFRTPRARCDTSPGGMIARRRPRWSRGLAAAGGLALAACAPTPPLYSGTTTPVVMTTPAEAGVVDLRGRYRAALCRRLPADGPPCDDVLLRLPGESAPPSAAPGPDDLRRYRIGFVPGLFSECFQALARPFADVIPELSRSG